MNNFLEVTVTHFLREKTFYINYAFSLADGTA